MEINFEELIGANNRHQHFVHLLLPVLQPPSIALFRIILVATQRTGTTNEQASEGAAELLLAVGRTSAGHRQQNIFYDANRPTFTLPRFASRIVTGFEYVERFERKCPDSHRT